MRLSIIEREDDLYVRQRSIAARQTLEERWQLTPDDGEQTARVLLYVAELDLALDRHQRQAWLEGHLELAAGPTIELPERVTEAPPHPVRRQAHEVVDAAHAELVEEIASLRGDRQAPQRNPPHGLLLDPGVIENTNSLVTRSRSPSHRVARELAEADDDRRVELARREPDAQQRCPVSQRRIKPLLLQAPDRRHFGPPAGYRFERWRRIRDQPGRVEPERPRWIFPEPVALRDHLDAG